MAKEVHSEQIRTLRERTTGYRNPNGAITRKQGQRIRAKIAEIVLRRGRIPKYQRRRLEHRIEMFNLRNSDGGNYEKADNPRITDFFVTRDLLNKGLTSLAYRGTTAAVLACVAGPANHPYPTTFGKYVLAGAIVTALWATPGLLKTGLAAARVAMGRPNIVDYLGIRRAAAGRPKPEPWLSIIRNGKKEGPMRGWDGKEYIFSKNVDHTPLLEYVTHDEKE